MGRHLRVKQLLLYYSNINFTGVIKDITDRSNVRKYNFVRKSKILLSLFMVFARSRGSLSPGSLLLIVLRQWFWCDSGFILIGVCVSCRFSYSVVNL